MRRPSLYTCPPRQRGFNIWAVLAMMATLPMLASAGQMGSGPIPVVVGSVTTQQVTTEVEVVGSVEPQLATTLSTEIAGSTQRSDLREGD